MYQHPADRGLPELHRRKGKSHGLLFRGKEKKKFKTRGHRFLRPGTLGEMALTALWLLLPGSAARPQDADRETWEKARGGKSRSSIKPIAEDFIDSDAAMSEVLKNGFTPASGDSNYIAVGFGLCQVSLGSLC